MLTNRSTFIGALLWLVPLAVSGPNAPSTPLKVLFIGNSYTSVNDLPAMVAAMAEAAGGRKIEVDRHLVGGCTLEKHVKDQKAIDKIRAKKWDVVVLQEQSLRPVVDRRAMHLAWGGHNKQSRSFLDKVLAQGVEFDILGQSYYPKWHGTLDDLKANLIDLAGRYQQDIMLVEYSVPNIREINDVVHGLPSGKGLGTFIWEPTKWEGPALFDGKGNTKPEIDVYPKMAEDDGLKDE
jgi:hypothetical protein